MYIDRSIGRAPERGMGAELRQLLLEAPARGRMALCASWADNNNHEQ